MKLLIIAIVLAAAPAFAQETKVTEPKCDPIGRTAKGELVYSILCRNIPGLAPGTNGYNPVPSTVVKTIPIKPDEPETK